MEKQIEKKACKNCIHYQMCVDKFRKAKQDGEVLLIEEEAYFADAGDCYFYADKRIYRKQEWISVEERLPEKNYHDFVLAWNGLHVEFLHYSHRYKQWEDYYSLKEHPWKVTHWMPLPEPPKGE